MKQSSHDFALSNIRVFIACLLSFTILITPFAAIAAPKGVRSPTVREGSKETNKSKNPRSSAAEDLFVNPPSTAPALPGPRPEPAPQPLAPPAPGTVTATMTASIANDDGDSKIDPTNGNPGTTERIDYSVTLSNNSGSPATGLKFDDTLDPHTTLVAGSVNGTPIAFDQSIPAINEDATNVAITLTGEDPDGSNITFVNVPSVTTQGGTLTGTAPNLTYNPAANFFGTDTFTFKVNDGTANSNEVGTVTITVNGVNDAPTFTTTGNPPASNEDAGAQSVSGFVTNISPGPANESTQTVSFAITNNTNASLFTVGGGGQPNVNIDSTGKLTYTAAANQNGTATITYHAHDSGGTANGGVDNSADQTFTITVNAVNDPPVVTNKTYGSVGTPAALANMKVTGFTGLLSGVTDADSGVNGCNPTFVIKNSSISATTPAGGIVTLTNANTGTFDFDPPPGVTGNVTFTYVVSDNGCPGVADSLPVTATIVVGGPVIWFVNPGAGPDTGRTGTLNNPFQLLASANTAMGSNANQRIFVYTGTTTSTVGVTLQASQWLIGQGATDSGGTTNFDTFMGISPPANTIARPAVNGTKPTIQGRVQMNASNTRVQGVAIAPPAGTQGLTGTSGAAMTGMQVGISATQSDVTVTTTGQSGTNAMGVSLNNAGGVFTFISINVNKDGSNNQPNKGISLTTTTGSFNVVGTGSAGTGGTIQNVTSRGLEAITATNLTLKYMNFTNANTANGANPNVTPSTCGDIGSPTDDNTGCNAAVYLQGVTGTVFDTLNVDTAAQMGINGNAVTGFSLANSTVKNAGNEVKESGIYMKNLTGTVSVTNSVLGVNHGWQFRVHNFAGALNFTTTGTTFNGCGFNNVNCVDGFLYSAGTGSATINISGSNFRNNHSYGSQIDTTGAAVTTTFDNNDFGTTNGATVSNGQSGGIALTMSNGGTLDYTVNNNRFYNTDVIPIVLTESGSSTAAARISGTISNNIIGDPAVANSGAASNGYGIQVNGQGAGKVAANITNNTISQVTNTGINIELMTNSSVGVFHIKHNTMNAPAVVPGNFAISVWAGNTSTGGPGGTPDNSNVCVEFGGPTAGEKNTINGAWSSNIGIRARQRFSTTYNVSGYSGGGANFAALQAYIAGNNNMGTQTVSATSTTAFVSTGATCAAVSPLMLAEGGVLAELNSPSLLSNFMLSLGTPNFDDALAGRCVVNEPNIITEPQPASTALEQRQLDSIVTAAIERWTATGLTAQQIATLQSIKFDLANLGGAYLGEADGNRILVDRLAQGKGWFIDPTPQDDSEFGKASGTRRYTDPMSAPAGHVDLLTAIEHEMGHKLGLDDLYAEKDRDNLMYGYLTVGERRLPSNGQALNATPSQYTKSHFLALMPDGESAAVPPDVRIDVQDVNERGSSPRASDSLSRWERAGVRAYGSVSSAPSPPTPLPKVEGSKSGIRKQKTAGSEPPSGAMFIAPNSLSRWERAGVRAYDSVSYAPSPPTPLPMREGSKSGVRTQDSGLSRSHHARNLKLETKNSKHSATTTAAPMPVAGSFPVNGTGSGFSLPFACAACAPGVGKTITITFSVTLNNPPNLTGVPPAAPQVSNHGTLTGTFIGATNPLDTNTVNTPVDLFDTTTTLGAVPSAGSWNVGQSITFTATVAPNPANATPVSGTVVFKDNGTAIAACNGATGVTLSSGSAQCVVTFGSGGHSVVAVYSGDGNYECCAAFNTSNTLSQGAVNQSGTTTTVISSKNPSNVNESVTFTATVASTTAFTGPPTGNVTFKDNGSLLTCANGNTSLQALSSGTATCQFTYPDTVGSPHSITAFYGGDTNFNASDNTASPLMQTVNTCLANPVVTSTADSGAGTLRDAIANICVAPNNTITFDAVAFAPAGGPYTISLLDANGELHITKDMTITGPGATVLTVKRDNAAATNFRIFEIDTSKTVSISGLTISNGKVSGNNWGGGIYNNGGTVTLNNSTLSGNSSSDSLGNNRGGGISNPNGGTLNITNSTLSGNSVGGNSSNNWGGGIFNEGTVTITDSTLSGNAASGGDGFSLNRGGGIYNNGGTVTLTSSTLSGNAVNGAASNTGGGIYNASGTANVGNTIVAGNSAGSGGPDLAGAFTSQGYNLIGKSNLSIGFTNGVNNDQVGSSATPLDPMLSALANNGGPTQTHALLDGSPALDAGNNFALTTLSADVTDNVTTTVNVTDASSIAPSVVILVDTEQMTVVSKAANVLTVARGANGSTATTHSNGANVYAATDQRGFKRTVDFIVNTPPGDETDIGAFERQTTPTAPGAPDLQAASDSGPSNSDNYTSVTNPTFDISGVANGDFVELLRDTNPATLKSLVASGTAASVSISLQDPSVSAGNYTYTARRTTGGLTSAESTGLDVTIDTSAPAAPGTPDLQSGSDTGVLDTDNITKSTSPAFDIGNTETGALVELLRGGVPVNSGTGNGGTLTLTDPGPLADNGYSYSARQTDAAGNTTSSAGALPITVDNTSPTVSMTSPSSNPTNTTPIPVTANFNEPVYGFVSTEVVATNATVQSFTGVDGNSAYPFNLAVSGSGIVNVSANIAVGVATDAAGNGNLAAAQFNRTYNDTNPTATITPVSPDPRNTSVTQIDIVFSKQVTGVDHTDFTLTRDGNPVALTASQDPGTLDNITWTMPNLNAPGLTDTASNPSSTYILTLNHIGSGIQDTAGNLLQTDASDTWVLDTTPPVATIDQAVGQTDPFTGPTSSSVINFKVTFSETPAAGSFTNTDISISGTAGATVANVSGSGTTYNVAVEGMTQSGTVIINIDPNTVQDDAGNNNTASTITDNQVQFNKDNFSTFEVNSTADPGDGTCDPIGTGDGCTLREAINAANADAGAETITFNSTVFAAPGPYTINLGHALPDIADDVTIQGPGANVLTVRRNVVAWFRIFTINSGKTVNISGVTITGGRTADGGSSGTPGGGIFNSGTLNLTGVAVSGNRTGDGTNPGAGGGNGGGIFSTGTLTLTNSTISGNQTGDGSGFGGSGGGISGGGTLTVTNSTISGNQTGAGGTGGGSGGGIFFNSGGFTLTLTGSTITGNTAATGGSGGGIVRANGTVTIKNTIIGGNTAPTGPDISGAVNSEGYNLIQSTSGATITETLNAGTNITGQDPQLFPLADNGGPTQTHALQCVSLAIDKGFSFGLTTDQRGRTRPFDLADSVYPNYYTDPAKPGDGSDIGAYETQTGGGCIPTAVPPNPQPSTNEDVAIPSITLTGTYSQNSPLTFTVTQNPSNGTLSIVNAPSCTNTAPNTCTETVKYTPTANFNGLDSFKFKVSAGALDSEEADVNITVNAVNDAPSFLISANDTVNEDAGPQTVLNFANTISPGPADESGQTVQFMVNNNTNLGLFSSLPALSPAGTLTYTPAPDANGSATITVVLKDNGGTANGGQDTSAPKNFTVTVNSVNDAPSFTKGPDQTVLENAGAQTVNPWATNISKGPADEAGQTLTFNLTNNNNALFSAQPAVSSTGTLTYTPAANTSGTAAITIVLKDNGGTAFGGVDTSAPQTFNITVSSGGTIQFSAATYSVAENVAGGNAAITITRTTGSAGAATVQFATSNGGTATAGSDYTAVSTTVNFADGDTSKTVNVPITNDVLNEPDETVNLTLSNVTGSSTLGATSAAVLTITNDDAAGGIISFSQPNYSVNEDAGFLTITVNRTGDTTGAATVDYATSDNSDPASMVPCAPPSGGVATSRCDFTTALGTLRFAAGETSKTFVVLISQDAYIEGPEAFPVALSNLTGGAVFAAPSTAMVTINDVQPVAANVIDVADIFVKQHYRDFLNREADAPGLAFWTNEITSCGSNAACIEIKRIHVSAAFFLSIEYQETGGYAIRTQRAAFGKKSQDSTRISYLQFINDARFVGDGVVIQQPGADAKLNANKDAYATQVVTSTAFTNAYGAGLTGDQFVTALFTSAGVTPTPAEQAAAVAAFGAGGTAGRAAALRSVADSNSMRNAEFSPSFVLLEYFGYMRRNPDPAGYNFWLNKLNAFNGDFIAAEMVKAFLLSDEYRKRFGP